MLINILLGESIFSPKEFKARRLKLAKKMELGSIAILQGAPSETCLLYPSPSPRD